MKTKTERGKTPPPVQPRENWLTEAMKCKPPVFVEYNGKRWKLKHDIVMTFYLVEMLDSKPSLIAEPAPDDNWFARESLAAVIRDCLEYNYSDCGYKGRGDCPTWRNQALWTLGTYAKGYFDDLDPQAKDPFYDIVKWMNGDKK